MESLLILLFLSYPLGCLAVGIAAGESGRGIIKWIIYSVLVTPVFSVLLLIAVNLGELVTIGKKTD